MLTLTDFATLAGITLGTGNDQPAFDLANAAIQAAASRGGLQVFIPPGAHYTCDCTATGVGLQLWNNGGYWAVENTVWIKQINRPSASSTQTYMVSLKDPYATGYVFKGININGGWTYGRAPYNTGVSPFRPQDDPWLDTQHGLWFFNQFSGVSDATYIANSLVGSQLPRGFVSMVQAFNLGGEGAAVAGAGANIWNGYQAQNCGGHGLFWNQYDSKIDNVDIGSTGRSGVWLGPNGSVNNWGSLKSWYAGYRDIGVRAAWDSSGPSTLLSNDNKGVFNDRGALNIATSVIVQDTSGTGLFDGGPNNTWIAVANWAHAVVNPDSNVAAVEANGAANGTYVINGSLSGSQPQVTQLVKNTANASSATASYCNFLFNASGWPGDVGVLQASWLGGTALAMTNQLTVRNTTRVPFLWYGDLTGRVFFGIATAASSSGAVGMTAWGDASAYPGNLQVYAINGSLQDDGFNPLVNFSTGKKLSFFTSTVAVQGTVTGSRGGNAALGSETTLLGNIGLYVNSTT